MKTKLTVETKADLEKRHKTERDGRIKDRLKAVLLSDEGWSHSLIAKALRIHESTVGDHLEDYITDVTQPSLNHLNLNTAILIFQVPEMQILLHLCKV